jgi:hypothetical protein
MKYVLISCLCPFKAILGAELHFINQTILYVGAFEILRKKKFNLRGL